mmetsp:Transcript_17133/g.28633  ORF Transcript_17133/g.28633 Transcript_17133/m.28633 type:complete len:335 (-) Transcript_17133:170-1174(-)
MDGVDLGDVAVVDVKLLGQLLAVARAEPVHAVVHDTLNRPVPGVIDRDQSRVIVGNSHVARVLDAIDNARLTVSDADDQVAGAVRLLDVGDSVVHGSLVLEHVTQHEHPGLSAHLLGRSVVSALSERIIGEARADLRDAHAVAVEAREHADGARPAHISKGARSLLARVVDRHLREVLEGAFRVVVKSTQLVNIACSLGVGGGRSPSTKEAAACLGDLSEHVKAEEDLVVHPGAVRAALQLIVELLGSVRRGHLSAPIKSSIKTEKNNLILDQRRKGAGEVFHHQIQEVLVSLGNKLAHVLLLHDALRIASLVGVTPHVHHREGRGSSAQLIQG